MDAHHVKITCCVLTVFDVVQTVIKTAFFFHGAPAPSGADLLTVEASRSHSHTPHTVGLLWTSDRLNVETST